ncbi:uncharacterized protein LOC112686475 [Sipha flava]|uniref:Uncharacterized protein LOC112686475 n=1 Tax=Sipha flava TaxID=143950 RepID=A0A8B8FUP6_9HEMI|nr:uncharacterized protein LOC112686475 [Sipha flava]
MRSTRHAQDIEGVNNFDVFLGGSCNPTTWRKDLAIPYLQQARLTFYNPQVDHWSEDLIETEHAAKENASILLYVIDSQTRNVVGGIESASLTCGHRNNLVLVIHPPDAVTGSTVAGEQISSREADDIREALTVLHEIATDQGILVFDNIPLALRGITQILKHETHQSNSTTKSNITYGNIRHVFNMFDTKVSGKINFFDAMVALRLLTNQNTSEREIMNLKFEDCKAVGTIHQEYFTFDQFHLFSSKYYLRLPEEPNRKFDGFDITDRSLCLPRECTNTTGSSKIVDIYLVGENGYDIKWTKDIAVPMIKKANLTYHIVTKMDLSFLSNACTMLFVIPNNSRSLATMTLAAYCIAKNCKMVLCIQHLSKNNSTVRGEKLTQTAINDYNRGRMYLADFASRGKVPVSESIAEAVEIVLQKLYNYCLLFLSQLFNDEKVLALNKLWIPMPGYNFPKTGKRNLKFHLDKSVGRGNHQVLGKLVFKKNLITGKKHLELTDFLKHMKLQIIMKLANTSMMLFFAVKNNQVESIEVQVNDNLKKEIQENQNRIIPMIKTVLFCGKQGIALRGHRDRGIIGIEDDKMHNYDNFRQLLRFRVDAGDKDLENHLVPCAKNADETSDISKKEKLTLCIRYVNSGEKEIEGKFVQFVEPAIISSIEEISFWTDVDTSSTANQLSASINQSMFQVSFIILVKLFSISVRLSRFLLTESLDLKQALYFANVTQNALKDIRVNAIKEFSRVFKSVETYCNKIGIDVCIPRISGRQAHRSNVAINNPESDISEYSKTAELQLWQNSFKHQSEIIQTKKIVTGLYFQCDPQTYPIISKLLQIFITLPVTTATGKRSFSTLRRIKTY